MLVVCFLRKKAVRETWKITYSMIYSVTLPKKWIRSGEAVRGGDSPSVASTSESTDGTGSIVRQKITLCLKVALGIFKSTHLARGLKFQCKRLHRARPSLLYGRQAIFHLFLKD